MPKLNDEDNDKIEGNMVSIHSYTNLLEIKKSPSILFNVNINFISIST